MLTTLAALFALLFSLTGSAAPTIEATPTSTTVQHVEEDEAGWDCTTMGNKACGPVPTADAGVWPPCATEDAAGPCYWDATTRGNGVGNSFTVDAAGAVTYLDAATR